MVDNGIINKFEKINVNEIVPKIYRIIGKIKICAATELIIILRIYLIILFFTTLLTFSIVKLPKTIIPKNPKYDNNTLKLFIEKGLFNKIISNDIPKLLAISYLLRIKPLIKLIIHIIHALIIEGLNPVRNINTISIIIKTVSFIFLCILKALVIIVIPIIIFATCPPDTDKI